MKTRAGAKSFNSSVLTRDPYIIVMPESRLWAGPYVCFHHAFAGLRKMPEPEKWFIVPRDGWAQLHYEYAEGWMKLQDAHELRKGVSWGNYKGIRPKLARDGKWHNQFGSGSRNVRRIR